MSLDASFPVAHLLTPLLPHRGRREGFTALSTTTICSLSYNLAETPKVRIPSVRLAQEWWSLPLQGDTYMDGHGGVAKKA